MEAIGCLVPKCRAKSIADVECNFLRKRHILRFCYDKFQCLRILTCYVKLTHVLVRSQLESQQRQLGKTVVVKTRVSIDRRQLYTDQMNVKHMLSCPK